MRFSQRSRSNLSALFAGGRQVAGQAFGALHSLIPIVS